jgi:hypothetical protein
MTKHYSGEQIEENELAAHMSSVYQNKIDLKEFLEKACRKAATWRT